MPKKAVSQATISRKTDPSTISAWAYIRTTRYSRTPSRAMSLSHTDQNEHISPPHALSQSLHIQNQGRMASSFQPSVSMGAMPLPHDMHTINQFYNDGLSMSLHQHLHNEKFVFSPPSTLNSNQMEPLHHTHAIPMMTGPQSFSGIYHTGGMGHVAPQGDLGYALQRPGVVPGGTSASGIPQMNQMYLHQAHMQPSSIGNLSQPSSYSDLGPMHPSSYMQAMSLPSIQPPTSVPQDHAFNQQQAFYRMSQQATGSLERSISLER